MKLGADVRDWVLKAEEDFAVVQTLRRKRRPALHNAVCFHAQQCAEKYLKALLTCARITFPKTHDLLELLSLAQQHESALELLRPAFVHLEPYAVALRYPGEDATRVDAKQAIRVITQVRTVLRHFLGLHP